MEITEVRIKLMEEPNDRLQAFCSITIDGSFVIRDLKIIQGTRGPFVAMPSRKLNDRCPKCGNKNELRAGYCSNCGNQLNHERATRDQNGRAKLYADIAHPINTECREMIQAKVLDAFIEEQVKSKAPDYICRYDDYGESSFAEAYDDSDAVRPSSSAAATALDASSEPKTATQPVTPNPPTNLPNSLERRLDAAETTASGPHGSPATSRSVSASIDDAEESFGVGIE